jgi:metal-dependent amidase/aminoacylase/carboxypeptidase family protein
VSAKDLPVLASEDFAYFTQERPGCFFFLGGMEQGRSNSVCHSTSYDFNDKCIRLGVAVWVRLIEDRFGVELFE